MAGSIQGDINQALGTLGALAQFSPQLKEHAEKIAENRKLDKREELVNERIQQAEAGVQPDVEGTAANLALKDANKEKEDILKKRYELNPTKETYSAYTKQKSGTSGIPIARLPADEEAQAAAMDRVGKQQEAMKKQKRNFMDYLSKMPMLGETVGSIDARNPGFAKQIASQYSSGDRRRIMNQMDREARDGKQ